MHPGAEKQRVHHHLPRTVEFEESFLQKVIALIDEQIDEIRGKFKSSYGLGGGDAYAEYILAKRLSEKIPVLQSARDQPYFGRIDYQVKGRSPETNYISKTGLHVPSSFEAAVIDWRTPKASIFYQRKLGPIQFHWTGEQINVHLIRQLDIHGGHLSGFHDLEWNEEHGGSDDFGHSPDSPRDGSGKKGAGYYDPALFARLGASATEGMKEIIETIQAEQDTIIRLPKNTPLLVQGSAGSGKTSIALHRIANLVYNSPEVKAEQFLFFGPNKMFLQYIEKVLPELEISQIEQKTFEEWCTERLQLKKWRVKVSDYYNISNALEKTSVNRKAIVRSCKLRGSLRFRDALHRYLQEVVENRYPNQPFEVKMNNQYGSFRIDQETIKQWFTNDFKHLPAMRRRERVIQSIKNEFVYWLKRIEAKQLELDENVKKLMLQQFSLALRVYQQKWNELSPLTLYYLFLLDPNGLHKHFAAELDSEELDYLLKHGKSIREKNRIDHDDLAALLYIHHYLYGEIGMPEKKSKGQVQFSDQKYHYVVIDEAQDYSPFQLSLISSVVVPGSIMILGDLGQSIHSYRGIEDWSEFHAVFPQDQQPQYVELSTSYRSTVEIVEWANRLIRPWSEGRFALSQPIGRRGKAPKINAYYSYGEMYDALVKKVKAFPGKKYESMAVITRSHADAVELYDKLLQENIDVKAMLDPAMEYGGGITVIPAKLTKGMEFDAVIVYDVSPYNYPDGEDERKLLYVAATRALHELHILYAGLPSPLIQDLL
jgi:DNA helicase-2/ATP-dependent DNA helicase PcrA